MSEKRRFLDLLMEEPARSAVQPRKRRKIHKMPAKTNAMPTWKKKKVKTLPDKKTMSTKREVGSKKSTVQKKRTIRTKATTRSGDQLSGKPRSKFSGVLWDERRRLWGARLTLNRKCHELGFFEQEHLAAQHVDKNYLLLRGDFSDKSRLNFSRKYMEYLKWVKKQRQILNLPPGASCKTSVHIETWKQQQDAKGITANQAPKPASTRDRNKKTRVNKLDATIENSNKTSKFMGVYKAKKSKKWDTQLRFKGKKYTGGRFDNEVDAAIAHDKLVVQYCGPIIKDPQNLKLKLNFPDCLQVNTVGQQKQHLKVMQPNEHLPPVEVFGEVEDERSSPIISAQDNGPLTFGGEQGGFLNRDYYQQPKQNPLFFQNKVNRGRTNPFKHPARAPASPAQHPIITSSELDASHTFSFSATNLFGDGDVF